MTPVYSGGLVYEYSEEGSGYGLVKINGNSVQETSDFQALMTALKGTNPSGDGGYKTDGQPSECPSQSSTWEVKDFNGQQLPDMPKAAQTYLKNGAGKGPGLQGKGSQSGSDNAGGQSTGTATPGSGSVAAQASGSSSPSSSSGAATPLLLGEVGYTPLICSGFVALFTMFGMVLV